MQSEIKPLNILTASRLFSQYISYFPWYKLTADFFDCDAEGGSRTLMPLRAQDFESCVSASSTTSALPSIYLFKFTPFISNFQELWTSIAFPYHHDRVRIIYGQ